MSKREPFIFQRHGQTDWNAKGILQGQTDVPLNRIGLKQADEAKTHLKGITVQTICSSPLARALQTAKIINEALHCQLTIVDELQECHFGEAEGKRHIGDFDGALIRSAESHGGESFENFVERALAGVNLALTHPGPVLIVSHGGVFNAVQSQLLNGKTMDLPNCVPVFLKPASGDDRIWEMQSITF